MNVFSKLIQIFQNLSILGKLIVLGVIAMIVFLPFMLSSVGGTKGKVIESPKISKPTLPPFPTEVSVQGELIIVYADGKNPEENTDLESKKRIDEVLSSIGLMSQEKLYKDSTDAKLKNYYLIKFNSPISLQQVAEKIYALPEIENAEANVKNSIF